MLGMMRKKRKHAREDARKLASSHARKKISQAPGRYLGSRGAGSAGEDSTGKSHNGIPISHASLIV